jgi:tRNA-splicing ligase RtcB (3'-phosphate/5'-hydroxy nucleic acid ligase)
MVHPENLHRISDVLWELPTSYREGMRVPGRLYATDALIEAMDNAVFDQLANVAQLPGITQYAFCMPDGHSGYGFPIGGVAAMDVGHGGVISPGGIGFDINCGMRLVRTNLTYEQVKPHIHKLVNRLFDRVPAGVGTSGAAELTPQEFRKLVEQGAPYCVQRGWGWPSDLELTEEGGFIEGADSSDVSPRALERGCNQVGTLGSGNHYLEVQRVSEIFDPEVARVYGIEQLDQVVVMFHCGSRGFGHQVATDYLRQFLQVMGPTYGIEVSDRELACAPFDSPEGQSYFSAMKCAINMAFASRQVILHHVRQVFAEIFRQTPEQLQMEMVYDVAHNTARLETHQVEGRKRKLLVHRKGATRAFGPGMQGVPDRYQQVGQPVILGGSMETGSYLLAGVPSGVATFYSTAHGAGRAMSRTQARHQFRGQQLQRDMETRGIYVRSDSWGGLAEEAGKAYKDVDQVVTCTERAGLSKRVARFIPIGNVKG